MLLRRLSEYADRLPVAPTLYRQAPVRYIIDLDATGKPLSRAPTDTADPSSRATKRGQPRLVPTIQRASSIKPLLLADKADYTLGLAVEGDKPERVAACHQAYLELLDRCQEANQEPEVAAVRSFLASRPLEQLSLPADFAPGEAITFCVEGRFVVDLPAVQRFWADWNDPAGGARQAKTMQCVVCGRERPVLDRMQLKLKGVPGGQTSGTSLISANADAFESYGLEASLVAPTCAECGERFTRAANALLADRENGCYVLGGVAFIFWTRDVSPFSFLGFLRDPQPADVRALLAATLGGFGAPAVDENSFYAAALSGSGGRAVVRDWLDTTVGEAKRHLALWFSRQRLVDSYGAEGRPLGLFALAAATVRDAGKDLAPPTPRALLRGALAGTPLPLDLLYEAVRRNRAEQGVTYPRAALMKLVLRSWRPSEEEDKMAELDFSNPSPAYRCGRLLAELEQVQTLAIPGAKATIVNRFYGAASSAPALAFGRLLGGAQAHLAKLQRDKPGACARLQASLEEIQSGLADFPRTLNLQQQALFGLGYYHQRAYDRAQAIAASQRRKAGQATAEQAASERETGESIAAEEE